MSERRVLEYPFFLYLLPVFFFLYGITHHGLHPSMSKILWPLLVLLVLSFLLHGLSKKLFQDLKQGTVLFFTAYFFYLFFGNIKEAIPAQLFLYSYFALLPFLFAILLLLWWLMKKYPAWSVQLFSYCNWLMILLFVIQTVLAFPNIKASFGTYMKPISFEPVKTQTKPSVYFVLFDEYPGLISLRDYFGYENAHLLENLRGRGFYVFDTMNSNYDKTVYSVNSMLNLQYVDTNLYRPAKSETAYQKNFLSIKKNQLSAWLKEQGYAIHNLSLFDLHDQLSEYDFTLLHTSNDLVMRNMFHEKLRRDLLWKLYVGRFRMDYFYNKYLLQVHHQNNEIIDRTYKIAERENRTPVFCFTHLLLPHEPYFTDSSGKVYDMEHETHRSDTTGKALEYLKYTNKRMIEMADTLLKNDPAAIIVFLSDHGYRDVSIEKHNYHCNSFMAIHLPDGNYQQISAMRSNVNLFRVLLNQYLCQTFRVLPDTSIMIDEERSRFTMIEPF